MQDATNPLPTKARYPSAHAHAKRIDACCSLLCLEINLPTELDAESRRVL